MTPLQWTLWLAVLPVMFALARWSVRRDDAAEPKEDEGIVPDEDDDEDDDERNDDPPSPTGAVPAWRGRPEVN